MLFHYALLASLAAGSALSLDIFAQPQSNAIRKRQETYEPPVTCSGTGTCAEACGSGYVSCSDAPDAICYNPGLGDICCEGGVWGCPSGSFCLIDDFCCPDGEDPATCAGLNNVTLPAGFTTTPAGGAAATSSSPIAAGTSSIAAATTSASASSVPTSAQGAAPTFNATTQSTTATPTSNSIGVANINMPMSSASFLFGVLALIGHLL